MRRDWKTSFALDPRTMRILKRESKKMGLTVSGFLRFIAARLDAGAEIRP